MNDAMFDKKNATLNITENNTDNTGETLPSFAQGGAGAAVCNGRAIQYAVPDKNGSLTLLTAGLELYQNSGQFSDLNNWTSTTVASHFPASMSANFKVQNFISIMSLGSYNYVFWLDTSDTYRVLRCKPDMLEPLAATTIEFPPIGNLSRVGNKAAFALPGTLETLAGKIGLVGLLYDKANETTKLEPLVLDPADFVANGLWQAQDLSGGLYPNLPSQYKSYPYLTAAWIDQGALEIVDGGSFQEYISLIIICHSEQASLSCLSCGMPLLDTFDVSYRLKMTDRSTPPSVTNISMPQTPQTDNYGATMCVAPDGRLACVYAGYTNSDRCFGTAYLTLNGTTSTDPNYGKPGLYSPSWCSEKMVNASTYNTPCAVFIPLPVTTGPSPVQQLTNADGSACQDCVQQMYVECMFTSNSDHQPRMTTFYWGTIFSVPNYIVAKIADDYRDTLLISMVADTFPYPVPEKSVWGSDSPSGMVNWAGCSYQYLADHGTGTDLDWDFSASIGLKTEGSFLVAGVGAQWELTAQGGLSTFTKYSSSTLHASSCSVTSKGLPAPEANPESTEAQLVISPEGAIFGNTPATQIGVDLIAVRLRGRDDLAGTAMAAVHPILEADSVPTAIGGQYETYCYTPGNLPTYTENAINKKMADLFNNLSADQRKEFVINGEDYSGLYSGNYIDNIVERFGSNSFGPGGDLPYLEFSFSETGMKKGEFQSTTGFTWGGGAFANHTHYVGVGWDVSSNAEIGFLGIVSLSVPTLSSSGFIMVGVEFSSSLVASSGTTDTWGISLDEFLNPLAPGEAYTVRMYILKPSPLWAKELEMFGFPEAKYPTRPKMDLVNSSPVRILFTVSYISDTLASRAQREF